MDKLYRDRDWLYQQYVVDGKSARNIASTQNVDRTTICNWLKKYSITIHGPANPIRNKISAEWLYKKYIEENVTAKDIAEILKIDKCTVYEWLRYHNVRVRSNAEAQHESRKNTVNITDDLLDVLNGELLGDGSLQKLSGNWASSYAHTSQYKEYVEWLSLKFSDLGLKQSGSINHRKDDCWDYKTLAYEELAKLRDKWYPRGKKIVPKDLILNKTIVMHWAIGDGSIAHPKNGRTNFRLYTNAFDKESMSVLIEQLSSLGIKATIHNSKNLIFISAYSTKDFIEYISPCPPEIESIYGYKFSYDGSVRYQKHPQEGEQNDTETQ